MDVTSRRGDAACEALVQSLEALILPDQSDPLGIITKLEAIQNARHVLGDLLNDPHPKMAWGVEWLATMGVKQDNPECVNLLNFFWLLEYEKDVRLVKDLTATDGPVAAQLPQSPKPVVLNKAEELK